MKTKRLSRSVRVAACLCLAAFFSACEIDLDGEGPLAAPGNLSLTRTTVSSVTFSWQSVFQADGYAVYMSKTNDDFHCIEYGVYDTEYTATTLESDTEYFFRVQALPAEGSDRSKGPLSSTLSAKTGKEPNNTLAVPASFSVTLAPGDSRSAVVSWSAVSGAAGYAVERSQSETGQYAVCTPVLVAGTVWTDTGLSGDVTYYYRVVAKNGIYYSKPTAPLSVRTVRADHYSASRAYGVSENTPETFVISRTDIPVWMRLPEGSANSLRYRLSEYSNSMSLVSSVWEQTGDATVINRGSFSREENGVVDLSGVDDIGNGTLFVRIDWVSGGFWRETTFAFECFR